MGDISKMLLERHPPVKLENSQRRHPEWDDDKEGKIFTRGGVPLQGCQSAGGADLTFDDEGRLHSAGDNDALPCVVEDNGDYVEYRRFGLLHRNGRPAIIIRTPNYIRREMWILGRLVGIEEVPIKDIQFPSQETFKNV